MKSIQIAKTGGPEVLKLADVVTPKPKHDEALVEIKAIGVNFIDVYNREGRYPAPLPLIPGQEASGIVKEIGEKVTEVKVGDRVAYAGTLGSYAEYAAVPSVKLIRVPTEVSYQQAAAAMLQGMTAHYLCHSTYSLKRGETVLIHAAAAA
jgi:NADPH2:quinone reductase